MADKHLCSTFLLQYISFKKGGCSYEFKSKKEQFLVDKAGRPKAVVLQISDFNKLINFIEDLEDALDLKRAIETSRGFTSHNDLLKRLKKQDLAGPFLLIFVNIHKSVFNGVFN